MGYDTGEWCANNICYKPSLTTQGTDDYTDFNTSQDNVDTMLQGLNGTYPPIVKPETFGAVGDGLTDDTVAIQAAIDSLAATGGIVQFSPATYLTGTLNYRSYTTLQGCGRATTLKLAASTDAPMFFRADGYPVDTWTFVNAVAEMVGVRLLNMKLDGNAANQGVPTAGTFNWLVFLQRITDAEIRNVSIVDAYDGGILLNQCRYSRVLYNYISNPCKTGSHRNGITSDRTFVGANTYNGYVASENGNTIRGNVVLFDDAYKELFGYCISSEYTVGDIVDQNICVNNAVGCESAIGCSITGNKIKGSHIQASDTEGIGPTGLVISGNELTEAYRYVDVVSANGPIIVGDYKGAVISDNTVSGLQVLAAPATFVNWAQIVVYTCEAPIVKGNSLLTLAGGTNQINGIYFDNCPGISIIGNNVHAYQAAGVNINGDDDGFNIVGNNFTQDYGTISSSSMVYFGGNAHNGNITENTCTNFGNLFTGVDSTATLFSGRKIVMRNNRAITGYPGGGPYMDGAEIICAVNSRTGMVVAEAAAEPTQGTWTWGSQVWYVIQTGSAAPGCICVTSGTFSAYSTTGDTDGSTSVITNVGTTDGIEVGDYIEVSAGFTPLAPLQVIAKTADTLTVALFNSDSAQVGVAITTPDPVFEAMGSTVP